MPESKRTEKGRRARPRTCRRTTAAPPIIESLPFHKEAYYAGLGLLDWTADRVGRLPAQLRILERQLVSRGQNPDTALTKQLEAARIECIRRGREFQSCARDRIRDLWTALRGAPRGDEAKAGAPSGAA